MFQGESVLRRVFEGESGFKESELRGACFKERVF